MATKDPLVLPAGDLRHSVTLLQQSATTDEAGSVVNWVSFATVRAAIDPVSGMELIRSGVDVTQTYITVKIRYIPGVTAAMRVQAANGTYVIASVENVLERNRLLKLTCVGIGAND